MEFYQLLKNKISIVFKAFVESKAIEIVPSGLSEYKLSEALFQLAI